MADAAVLYTRGDANAADQRGESMVERHQRKIREEKEYSAHAQLKVLMPDAGPALRNLALEGCEWDVDRARTMIKRFREVKAKEIKHVKDRLEAAGKEAEDKAIKAKEAAAHHSEPDGKPESNDSSSGSDSESDGSSGSDGEDHRKDRKRSSKHHKHKKESSRKRHKESKRRKDSKRDREEKKAKRHKRSKQAAEQPRTAALTHQYGKYGIIRESDYEAKRGDFQLWATEVKKVEIEVLPKWEERELFKTYMEDFNTGTLPHKKYYDNDGYERAKALKEMKKGKKSKSKTEWTAFDDEEDRRREAAKRRAEEEEERKRQAYNELRYTTNKAQEMREQELLRQQMNLAYRTGNMDEARRIQERLNPDEDPNKP